MADEKKHTDRDLILAKREGYRTRMTTVGWPTAHELDDAARKAFPLPPQTRPRVVTDSNGRAFRVAGGQLQTRHARDFGGEWRCVESGATSLRESGLPIRIDRSRVAMWDDLYAHPTEPVPEEEL